MSKIIKLVITVIVIIIACAILFDSVYLVKPNEYIIIRRMGRIQNEDTIAEQTPGLHFKTPLFESTTSISRQLTYYDIPVSDVITKDKKSMVVDSFVLWQIKDPTTYIRTLNATQGRAEERIEAAVYNATKQTISSMDQEQVIQARGENLTATITTLANKAVQEYGITINTAQIKTLSLPPDNLQAVFARMISERNKIKATYEADGQAEAQKIKNNTDKEIALIQAEADKTAAIRIAEGEQEYMRIMQNAYNSPEKADFYQFLRGLDALLISFTGDGEKTIVLDQSSELVRVLFGDFSEVTEQPAE